MDFVALVEQQLSQILPSWPVIPVMNARFVMLVSCRVQRSGYYLSRGCPFVRTQYYCTITSQWT